MRPMGMIIVNLVLVSLLIVTVALGLGVGYLYTLRDVNPAAWNEAVVKELNVSFTPAAPNYQLSLQEAELAQKLGMNPVLLARASSIEGWAEEMWGPGVIGRGILMALTSGESANCSNAGRGKAAAWMRARGFHNDLRAFYKLLEVWKRHDIRSDPDSYSSQYIPPDYNPEGVIGSVMAGALGCSQFMPGTAYIHFGTIGEPFDLWNPETAMKLMASELKRLGWRENLSIPGKVRVLLGWNYHPSWVTYIANTAATLTRYYGYRTGISILQTGNRFFQSSGMWQRAAATFLQWVGLMPDVSAMQNALADENASQIPGLPNSVISPFGCSYIVGFDAAWHLSRANQGFPAWDIVPRGCSSQLYAPIEGTLTYREHRLYGNQVIIEGTRFRVRMAHLLVITAPYGKLVHIGDPVGTMGMTGNAMGPHVHLEIYDKESGGYLVDPARVMVNKTFAQVRQEMASMPSLGLPTATDGLISLDLTTEVSQRSGEVKNIVTWAKSNQRIVIEPGGVFDFCTQTDTTGWSQYRIAAGVPANGICFNASMIRELANNDPRLKVLKWSPHEWKGYSRLHTVIWCSGTTLKVQNISEKTLALVWSQNGNKLLLSVEETSN